MLLSSIRLFSLFTFCSGLLWATSLWAQSRADVRSGIKRHSLDSLRAALTVSPLNEVLRLHLLNTLAQEYQYTSPDSSLLYAAQARSLADRLGKKQEKAWALYYTGYALYNQGKYDVTLETLLEALLLFEAVLDNHGVGHTLNDLGNIYKRQGQYETAIDYYRKSLTTFQVAQDNEGIVLELCNMGATYRLSGQHDESLQYSQRGLHLADSLGYTYGRTFAKANIGFYYLHTKDYNQAERFFEEALELANAERNEKYISQMSYTLGIVAAHKKNFARALEYAERGSAIAQQGKFAERIKESYKAFVEIYTMQGNFSQALLYQQRYSALHDSIFSAEVRDNIALLQTKVATEKKDKEILLLHKDQEFATLLRNSLIGGLALVAILLTLAISRYNIKRKAEQQLTTLNNNLAGANVQLASANASLADANVEISRQLEIQSEQAREIEIANVSLHEMNLRLETQNAQLVELNMEKNEFLGIAAHDLKNPLNGIRGLAELLQNYGAELAPEDHRKILNSIVSSSERMFDLIKNLLDINAIEQGGVRLNPVVFDIAPLVAVATDSYRIRAQEKNITLHFDTEKSAEGNSTESSGEERTIVRADEQAAAQVIDNLISNAVKYSPHGKNVFVKITRTTRTITHEEMSGEAESDDSLPLIAQSMPFVRIFVQDEGPGLSEVDKQKLFGKFARLSAQPTNGEHSTGLGLSIVKRMVEAMHGHVWCESEIGQGATFIVEFPAA